MHVAVALGAVLWATVDQTAVFSQENGASVQPHVEVNSLPSSLLQVPVSGLFPGDVRHGTVVASPVSGDPEAAARGMELFTEMNCVGCHAPNGAGGMGPALSNRHFTYGGSPENIYLTILQGRPNGMPSWGGMLPDTVIWDLVAYIQSISQEPRTQWGKTTSASSPEIEQVPAENIQTTTPWEHTERFGYGQAPNKKAQRVSDQAQDPVR